MDEDKTDSVGCELQPGEKGGSEKSPQGDNKNLSVGPDNMEVAESDDTSLIAKVAPESSSVGGTDGSRVGGKAAAERAQLDGADGSSEHHPCDNSASPSQDQSNASGHTVSDGTPEPRNSESSAGESQSYSVPSSSGADIDVETAGIYAKVASTLVTKVNQLNDAPRQSQSGTSANNRNSSARTENESLSLIMSYDISDEDSGEETEKEEGIDNFTAPRYVPISSGCSSGDEESSEDDDEDDDNDDEGDENTDGGSSVESEEAGSGDEESNARSVINTEKEVDAAATVKKGKSRRDKDLRDPLMLDLLPPIEKLAISVPEEDCVPVGKIYSIVDRLVVIESLPDTPPLMLDSVIFNREGSALGQIFDIFGHVKRPFYSIRFNTPEEIKNLNVSVGRVVYCAPKTDHTKYVFTHDLMKEKGSDASWKNDEEPPPSAIDYSDDEAERRAKKGSKVKREADADSPARRRHLSFEQQMNRNNTLRNRAFKRDAQGEARNNWDGGWHNYKKNNPQQFQANYDPPPPPPPRQIQTCAYANPTVNPMNLVIRPPCFNPVIERPPVPIGPSPTTWAPWARFEPPPTPPPRGFQYPSSPPSGGFQPNFALGPFQRFQSPPSSGFPGFGSSTYGPPPMAFSPPAPAFSSPPPPSLPMQQPPVPSRFGAPPPCRASLPRAPLPPAPFSGSPFTSYHPPKPANPNHTGNHPSYPSNHHGNHGNHPGNHPNQPRIPRLPFSSNNNHPPLYNHPPF